MARLDRNTRADNGIPLTDSDGRRRPGLRKITLQAADAAGAFNVERDGDAGRRLLLKAERIQSLETGHSEKAIGLSR